MCEQMVCFDWGGVILRICRNLMQGCEAAGLEYRADVDTPAHRAARREVALAYQRGRIAPEEYRRGVIAASDGAYSFEEIVRLENAWLLGEYPGVGELVAELNRTAGVTTGLLSNTYATHWQRQLPGPDGEEPEFPTAWRLRHRHASHLLGLTKPDPAIYRAFERQTGYAGERVLFFDDLPENVEAARSVGWSAELIDPEGDTGAQMRGILVGRGILV